METKTVFERVIELHQTLRATFFQDHEVHQSISDHSLGCGAYNQPTHQIECQTYIAEDIIVTPGVMTDQARDKYHQFAQGFWAVEISLRVVWGGRHHDGTPITTPEIRFGVYNRLDGGMATQSWAAGDPSNYLDFDGILPLVRSLLDRAPDTTIRED